MVKTVCEGNKNEISRLMFKILQTIRRQKQDNVIILWILSHSSVLHYITVLYSTVQYCTVMYCYVLFCTVLYCSVLYCYVLYCSVLYCSVLYWYWHTGRVINFEFLASELVHFEIWDKFMEELCFRSKRQICFPVLYIHLCIV